MPVPFETLIPYGIILAMFGVTGAGMSKIKNMQNGGKRARRSVDQWDRNADIPGTANDGSRPTNHWIPTWTVRFTDSTGRLRAEQPLESTY
ncbi:small secreted protein [Apiospora rasikravindrae]|uniref:NADH dehydrogenase [ubiquinone] 1 alpha subcomplex subunit 1 n=1 Tax=Apiospora rasikravindrae TaxID=990691 RepID=A0ABR1TF33_9PEZI